MNANRNLVRRGKALVFASLIAVGSAELFVPGLATPAHAVVGRPATPVSVAGVARRSVRRTAVVATSSSSAAAASASASASASQQQAAAAQQDAALAQQEAAAAQQQAAQAQAEAAAAKQQAAAQQAASSAALPIGTTVSGLPNGCSSINIGGVDYFNCGGTYYRPAFQSNNLVYVVSKP